jgi:hypothetical protein
MGAAAFADELRPREGQRDCHVPVNGLLMPAAV